MHSKKNVIRTHFFLNEWILAREKLANVRSRGISTCAGNCNLTWQTDKNRQNKESNVRFLAHHQREPLHEAKVFMRRLLSATLIFKSDQNLFSSHIVSTLPIRRWREYQSSSIRSYCLCHVYATKFSELTWMEFKANHYWDFVSWSRVFKGLISMLVGKAVSNIAFSSNKTSSCSLWENVKEAKPS